MILFAVHAAIAVVLSYTLIRAIAESGKKDLIVPVAGIATLFIIHCAISRSSCLECTANEPRCMAELLTFWLFAGWATLQLIRGGGK